MPLNLTRCVCKGVCVRVCVCVCVRVCVCAKEGSEKMSKRLCEGCVYQMLNCG